MSFNLLLTVSLVCPESDEIVSFSIRLCSNSKGSRKSVYLRRLGGIEKFKPVDKQSSCEAYDLTL